MTGRVRGWCPSLFEPMASGDGLLARVKPPLGRLSAEAARALAVAAQRFGNGQLELTNRAALQVRGLSEASLPPFQQAVLAAGLASADPAVERRRNLVVSPLASAAGVALATELEAWIADDPALAALPSKFGFTVEAPGGDIGVEPDPQGWRIRLAGCEASGLTAEPFAAIRIITHRFLALAAEQAEPPRRMADLVGRCGPEAILTGVDVAEAPNAPSVASRHLPRVAVEHLRPRSSTATRGRWIAEGETEGAFLAAGEIGNVFALGLPFGAFTADDLDLAADFAERFADGELRTSPWRALVLAGVSDPASLEALARAAGFLVDPQDPRLSVIACTGAPGCASAHAATRIDAAVLAAQRLPGRVHLAGCAKGCAHPAPTAFTLVATADGYDLVRDGRAGALPERRGLTLSEAARLLNEIP
ncbi:precorrin-3B synthase [Phenylobacterium sp. LjRoot225]|uniref:precorrin-3B synthase n=1 Tax=Phenylobacterium sp. LjRoot225 TaxID=3342285 RepID=UPI003ED12A59